MALQFSMQPIGVVRNERSEPIDDGWDLIDSTIALDPEVLDADATVGLLDFSHVEVVYVFDRVSDDEVVRGARHPRGNPAWLKVGILAQRPKARPNRIGTTVCELMAVRPGGLVEVRGLDAIDGTPVLDIKPYFAEFAPRGDVRQPSWSRELMVQYWVDPSRTAARLTTEVADAWHTELLRSPSDVGTFELIVGRPAVDAREVMQEAHLDVDVGLVGDNWLTRAAVPVPAELPIPRRNSTS